MNKQHIIRIIPALLLATAALAGPEAKKDIVIRRAITTGSPQRIEVKLDQDAPREMEKVAYLGVETAPVDPAMAAQLGLSRGVGLVVRRVAEGSPAAGVLQPHDILTRLDDQLLVNMPQLTVLVRNHKAGDEVKLTYIRAGKEATAKVKLGEREVPKLAWEGPVGAHAFRFFSADGPEDHVMFRELMPGIPALGGAEAGDVMRLIAGDRMHWFSRPRVHVFKHGGGKGSTILDLPSGNFVFSDEKGSVEVNAAEGRRELTIKDKDGKVTYQGLINTGEEQEKLPPEVKERLEVIGGVELGEGDDGIEVETKVFAPLTKANHPQPAPKSEADLRSL